MERVCGGYCVRQLSDGKLAGQLSSLFLDLSEHVTPTFTAARVIKAVKDNSSPKARHTHTRPHHTTQHATRHESIRISVWIGCVYVCVLM